MMIRKANATYAAVVEYSIAKDWLDISRMIWRAGSLSVVDGEGTRQ